MRILRPNIIFRRTVSEKLSAPKTWTELDGFAADTAGVKKTPMLPFTGGIGVFQGEFFLISVL